MMPDADSLSETQPESPVTVNFDDTAIAFAHQSHVDLRRAWWLFRLLGQPQLVKGGKLATQLGFALKLPISPLIRLTLFKQFVGGESIADCDPTIQRLAQYGIGSILDYSAEGQADQAGFERTQQELLQILARAAQDEDIPFAVFKPTGLMSSEILAKASQWGNLSAQDQRLWEQGVQRIRAICQQAVASQTPVLVDAEESWLQPAIDRLVLDLMREFNQTRAWVWNTLQMYRRDRLGYFQDLLEIAEREGFQLGLKLVRGAYMEKERERAASLGIESPIQPSKAATDQAFDAALELCLAHISRVSVCVGSHNEASNLRFLKAMNAQGLSPRHPHIWFAQLLGMSDHISFNLAQAGYHVAKYVPYAPIRELVPYLIRRAEENTSVRGQSSRELELLQREMKRRGLL